jgi:putative ATP-binding cassette transporter
MYLFNFFKKIGRPELKIILLLTLIAGISNSLLIVSVNDVAYQFANNHPPNFLGFTLFVGAFCIYYFCDRNAMLRSNLAVERELKYLRQHTVSLLRESSVEIFEGKKYQSIPSILSRETNHLSVTFPIIIDSCQQFVLLIASLAYLAYLSLYAFFIFISVTLIGTIAYFLISKKFQSSITSAHHHQNKMTELVSEFLNGCKEMRQNTKLSDSVMKSYSDLSSQSELMMIQSGNHVAMIMLLFCALQYSMLGLVVFVLPIYIPQDNLIIFQLIPTILFCIGPVAKIVGQFPMFIRAETGLTAISLMNFGLRESKDATYSKIQEATPSWNQFQCIEYSKITYHYPDADTDQTFTSGPWSLEVKPGEIIFLVGGNGSGKSTALHLITGLYQLNAGEIFVDGKKLDENSRGNFRELFSAIFSNFHLFDRLYGHEDIEEHRVNQLIDEMQLSGKVKYENGRFTDLNLSTGQRKRLALIVALLEDKPIYIFDEWSAEQDVHFRAVYYEQILPKLRNQGKTVIAVTHDERYWGVADRIVKFDLGKIQWERSGKPKD